jgi:hypothetical protein
MHAHGQLISLNLCCVKMLQLGFQVMSFDKTKPMKKNYSISIFRILVIAKTMAQE